MVKNTFGGNKSKGFARKHTGGKKDNILRVSTVDAEIYAIVTKMCGNGMFECYCIDKISRLCHIRGKFTGKGKRDNIVSNGSWVLIGVREWDNNSEEVSAITKSTKKEKLPKCDLLEVYNDSDKEKLRDEVVEDWKILVKHDPTKIENDNGIINDDADDQEDGFKFSSEKDIERDILLKEAQLTTTEKITLSITNDITDDDMVSFEDL
jgi:initiation factor 1A